MEAFGSGSVVNEPPNSRDLKQLGNSIGDTLFDASQYAFFGEEVLEEVELGGLDEEDESVVASGLEEEEFVYNKNTGTVLRSQSDMDDQSNALSKVVSGSRNTGFIREGVSRESSSAAEWMQQEEFPNWTGHQMLDPDNADGKRWSSQPFSSAARSTQLYRTSSYPEQQHPPQPSQHPHFSSEPITVPKSSFTSHPPPGGNSLPNNHPGHLNMPYASGGLSSSPNHSPFTNSQLQMSGFSHGSHFGGMPVNNRPPNWGNQGGLLNNMLQQQMSHQNGIAPPQPMTQQQRLHHAVPPPFNNVPGMQSQLFNLHLSPSPSPPMMNRFDHGMLGLGDLRDQRPRSSQKGRPGQRYPQMGFDMNSQRGEGPWPTYRSKYMSPDEIEGILRMQLAATHSNDPYVEDYYHQASLAKKSNGAKLRHHFCPNHLRELPSRARANAEPHAFLQVDALGRIPFSSIRRPRPLLEMDSSNSSNPGSTDQKITEKPLEQEPLLAARVAIEDGLCLLLDVDDIDRFLKFNQLPDAGSQLRRRRQVLLEDLAASLQLVDPLGKNGHTVGLVPKDDFVFLRLVSLPKGRKLVGKYLRFLFPGGDLVRIVCMAIFRHLRFLFGILPADSAAAETTNDLAVIVSSCIREMDLGALSACLAAVVCSSEQPPLRPLGGGTGDGATLILKSVLERATELFTDPHAAGNYNATNRGLWQASFDEFFGLLIKYCVNKYESVMQMNTAAVGADAARSIGGEMPVELLRASLPHTDEQQRRLLLDFTRRSMNVSQGN